MRRFLVLPLLAIIAVQLCGCPARIEGTKVRVYNETDNILCGVFSGQCGPLPMWTTNYLAEPVLPGGYIDLSIFNSWCIQLVAFLNFKDYREEPPLLLRKFTENPERYHLGARVRDDPIVLKNQDFIHIYVKGHWSYFYILTEEGTMPDDWQEGNIFPEIVEPVEPAANPIYTEGEYRPPEEKKALIE
jgi:hypothetical protein